jgi:lysophospholipase L1-like esterase
MTFGQHLERQLSDLRVEVFNRGIPGYSALQGVHLLRYHLRDEDPNVAIINYGWNDTNESTVTDAQRLEIRPLDPLRASLHRSRFYMVLTEFLLRWTRGSHLRHLAAEPTLRVTHEEYLDALVEIVATLERRGCVAVLVTKPYNPSSEEAAFSKHQPAADNLPAGAMRRKLIRVEDYNRAVLAAAVRAGCRSVDLAQAFRRYDREAVFDGPVHPSAEGHRRIAELLAPVVREALSPLERAGQAPAPSP